jgi:hypothetical protein
MSTQTTAPTSDDHAAAPSGRIHRLPALPPDLLTDKQKSLAADMKEGVAKRFQGFVNVRDDGALLGPWNPWLHHPRFGGPIWDLTKVVASNPFVPAAIRELAILLQRLAAHRKASRTSSMASIGFCRWGKCPMPGRRVSFARTRSANSTPISWLM